MRQNKSLDEYVSMLHIDIDTLEAVVRHIEIAKALYQTKFVSMKTSFERHCVEGNCEMLDYDIMRTKRDIAYIHKKIEFVRWLHESRASRKALRRVIDSIPRDDMPF